MRMIRVLAVLVAVAGVAGCQQDKDTQVAEAPPLEPLEPAYEENYPEPVNEAASVSAYEPAPEPQPVYRSVPNSYTIQRGDTLWSIATRFYRDGHRWRDIQAANPGIQPTKLRVGQKIVLP